MHSLEVGPLKVVFHRTVRVSAEGTSALPPSLGNFQLYKVSDYKDTCPEGWEENAVFIPMHDEEALWMSFDTFRSSNREAKTVPVAVLIGAGGINALTGEKLGLSLEKENYLVTPPQPWLDGWKDKDGTVYQFVGTRYEKGEGLSVGEQILGSESKTGGIGIAVFEAKDPDSLTAAMKPQETWGYGAGGFAGGYPEDCKSIMQYAAGDANLGAYYCAGPTVALACSAPMKSLSRAGGQSVKAAEMGVGKGGKINQKVYSDPHGLDKWNEKPSAAMAVYLVNAEMFSQITGQPMPPLPVEFTEYHGKWFGLKDKDKGDVQGTDKFTGLKNVFAKK
jgi:hypothetical protein